MRKPGGASEGTPSLTPFTLRLYAACRAVPEGRVTTYGEMAAALGSCARAVGQGMRRNPYAPTVPCHRVIAATRQLGGFNGSWGEETANVKRKLSLLLAEGVRMEPDGRRVEAACVVRAAELLRLMPKDAVQSLRHALAAVEGVYS